MQDLKKIAVKIDNSNLNISSSIGNLSSVLSSAMKNYQSQIEQLNISSSIGNLSSVLSSVTKNYQSQIEQLNISSSIGNLSSVLNSVTKNYQSQIQDIKKIANFSSLDLKALNETILSYDRAFCDSSEFKEANVIEVKNEEINLKDIENIINAKLERKSEDCITIANTIIYWLRDIKEGQDQIINSNSSIKFKQVVVTILLGLLVNFIFLLGQNFYNSINKCIISNPKQVIQVVKQEFKQITLNNANKYSYEGFMYSNKDKLEVKNTNSKKSFVIYKLDIGSIVKVISKKNEWINIKFIDKNSMKERQGWVLSKYLKKFKY
jgi:hypothetical protein